MKFTPLDSRNPTQVSYNVVKETLVNEVLKTFERAGTEIARSLETEVEIVLPEPALVLNTDPDADVRKLQNLKIEYKYKDEVKRWMDKKEHLQNGLARVYGMLWSDYMSVTMITRIEQHPDFAGTIKNSAVELLKAIKASMHETVRAQKPIITMMDALSKMLSFKQHDLGMAEYIKSFKEVKEVFETQVGKHLFDSFVEQQPGYSDLDDDEKLVKKNQFVDQWYGYIFLKQADWRKYGTILTELSAAYARGRDEYPIDLKTAIDYLDTHKVDPAYKTHQKQQQQAKKDAGKGGKTETSFAQKSMTPPSVFAVVI
jgi:hypothetical protein